MHTIFGRTWALVAMLLLGLASEAWSQGYSVAESDQPPLALPIAARLVQVDAVTHAAVIDLPFAFRYFGEPCDHLLVSADGFVVPGGSAPRARPQVAALPLLSGDADGAIAPRWQLPDEPRRVQTWIAGTAPRRRLVIDWTEGGPGPQLHLHESSHRITFTYRGVTGRAARAETLPPGPPSPMVRGLDEPAGRRFLVPPSTTASGSSLTSFTFEPRVPEFHPPGIGRELHPARWLDVRKEATVPRGSTRRASYLAKGRHAFHVRDRALFRYSEGGAWRKQPPEVRERLLAEDRTTFGGQKGDARRWVRQVLDGKMIFLPAAPGSPPLRVWFRIVEYFSLDDRGNTLTDHHTWNLRWMLSNAFRDEERKEPIDGYWAWKAMARGRLTVGKLFKARQTDDAGKQYSSGRKNEYLLWSGRLRRGTRGALARYASPTDGWVEFALREEDMHLVQHVERADLRFVADPNYVDGHYEYTVSAPDNAYGWMTGRDIPEPPIRDEGFDADPGRAVGPITPR